MPADSKSRRRVLDRNGSNQYLEAVDYGNVRFDRTTQNKETWVFEDDVSESMVLYTKSEQVSISACEVYSISCTTWPSLFLLQSTSPPCDLSVPKLYSLEDRQSVHPDFCCKGPFRGFSCGDDRGVGKAVLALLGTWLVKDLPGFYLVSAPKSVLLQ